MKKRGLRSTYVSLGLLLLLNGVATALNQAYTASFLPPVIKLNQSASVYYQVNLTSSQPTSLTLSVILCQSSRNEMTNTWQVLNLLSDFCLASLPGQEKSSPGQEKSPPSQEKCKNQPFNGQQELQFTLIRNSAFNYGGNDNLDNFFLCMSQQNNQSTICDYVSSYFNISLADAGTKPVYQETSNTPIKTFPIPTPTSIEITTVKSILQTSPSAATLVSTSSTPGAVSPAKKKKGLSIASVIGIVFGIFGLFLFIGFIGLILRGSYTKKRAQTTRSRAVNPYISSNLKEEKENSESPISPTGWTIGRNISSLKRREDDHNRDFTTSQLTAVPQMMTVTRGGPENEVHLRDFNRQSIVKRDSKGSVSISPIPSRRSESLYDSYQNYDQGPNIMRSGSAASYLREDGMSPEEIARLEDEERRIDAAIAAAEAEKAQARRH